MPNETDQEQAVDLDKTDRLPVLPDAAGDDFITDDAVPLVYSAPDPTVKTNFARPSHLDLPSLAESVRTIEERIARQHADYQELSQAHERALDAQAAAVSRANALAAQMLAVRAQLEGEQARATDLARGMAEKNAALELAHARTEDAAHEAQRLREETRFLRETLVARDATIVQVLQSLAERDAQLTTLRCENATIVPALEAQSRTGKQLETELQSALATAAALKLQLSSGTEETTALSARIQHMQAALDSTKSELGLVTRQSASYLEQLRTRAWRSDFDQNLFRDMDAALAAMQGDAGTLKSELDTLNRKIADLAHDLAERDEANGKLMAAVSDHAQDADRYAEERRHSERVRAELTDQVAAFEAEKRRLAELLALRDAEIEQSRAAAVTDLQHVAGALEVSERRNAEQSAQIQKMQADHDMAQQEIGVLVAHLQEARRPTGEIEAELRRSTDELAKTTARLDEIDAENRDLKDSLERSRGALEEREFLIRRLERSESVNASALGRIQTSIERLAAPPAATVAEDPHALAPLPERSAALVRIDGTEEYTHVLGRRTRIGRASGSDLSIDSPSVSRNHAVILLDPRGAIIEDINSTNGVVVNGARVKRRFLRDGDIISIGEARFRFRTG